MRTRSRVLSPHRRAYTLLELCVTLVLICLMAGLIYPFATGGSKTIPRQSCASNLRQIGVAALMYAHDNDETLPPAISIKQLPRPVASRRNYPRLFDHLFPSKNRQRPLYTLRYWFGQTTADFSREPQMPDGGGFLQTYAKPLVFRCRENQQQDKTYYHGLGSFESPFYRVNDNAGAASLNQFVRPSVTVLAMDGETETLSIGHQAGSVDTHPSAFNQDIERFMVWQEALQGGTVRHAVRRHGSGANYLFADGHVEALTPQAVYFPSGNWREPNHINMEKHAIGPDPGGDMVYQKRKYAATFHAR